MVCDRDVGIGEGGCGHVFSIFLEAEFVQPCHCGDGVLFDTRVKTTDPNVFREERDKPVVGHSDVPTQVHELCTIKFGLKEVHAEAKQR